MHSIRLALVVGVLALGSFACAPAYAPTAASACPWESLIRSTFVESPDHAVAVAWRESRCELGARNPSGASGLFQLMRPMHDDLLRAACPAFDPSVSWGTAWCNVQAAHLLYLEDGWAPWGG